jgi:hypothetical protein
MHEVVVSHTGRDDFAFRGKLLAKLRDLEPMDSQYEWLSMALYSTSVGKYVLSINRFGPDDLRASKAVCFRILEDAFMFLEQEGFAPRKAVGTLRKMALATDAAFRRLYLSSCPFCI